MKRQRLVTTSFFAAVAVFSINTLAQQPPPPTPEEIAQNATATRQAVFKLLGHNMGPIGGMARGAVPFDAALAQRNAERMAVLGGMIPELFANDTRAFEVETLALDKIWDNQDDFASKAAALVDAAKAFATAAQSGDQQTTMGALRPLGGACGNCHDNYRLDQD